MPHGLQAILAVAAERLRCQQSRYRDARDRRLPGQGPARSECPVSTASGPAKAVGSNCENCLLSRVWHLSVGVIDAGATKAESNAECSVYEWSLGGKLPRGRAG